MTHTFEVTVTGYIAIDAPDEDQARDLLDAVLSDPDAIERNFSPSGDQSKARIELLPEPVAR